MFKTKYQTPKSLGIHYGADKDGEYYILGLSTRLDVNRDGRQDVLVGLTSKHLLQVDAAPVKILISNGDTLLDQTAKYLPFKPSAHFIRNIYVADFNGDKRDDIYLNSTGQEVQPFPGEQNRLFLSNSHGTFSDATKTSLPKRKDFSHSGGVGDFDGDGDIDIISNSFGTPTYQGGSYLLFNDGRGKFTEVASFTNQRGYFPDSLGWGTYWIHVVDMNGDERPDLYQSGMEHIGDDPSVTDFRGLINDGTGHFAYGNSALPAFPKFRAQLAQDAHSSDIDHDGDLDILLFDNGLKSGDYIQILVNDGAGNYTDQSWRIPEERDGRALKNAMGMPVFDVVDLDGDGDDDIFYRGWPASGQGSVSHAFENRGDGTFVAIPDKSLPQFPGHYQILDHDGDGLMDILTDVTWYPPWQKDKHDQFLLWKGAITIAVNRKGWSTDDRIVGGYKSDTLDGRDGNDRLAGGDGKDTIYGGAGLDVFILNTKPGPSNVDSIRDFVSADDSIWLDNAIFPALGRNGSIAVPAKLKANAFWTGKAAHDTSDRVIYTASSGALYYDPDGTGAVAKIKIAQLSKNLDLVASDFFAI